MRPRRRLPPFAAFPLDPAAPAASRFAPTPMFRRLRPLRLALPLLATFPVSDGYRLPPKEVVELVDAPVTPGTQLSPSGRWM